jgi:histone-lysine N-methyltransferase SETMAR
MASVLWDAEGILFIDYLEKGKTITGEYSNLLTRLDKKVREKRPGLQKKKIIFYQDSAPTTQKCLGMGKLRHLHYELLEHPPFSPDLASSDFCLFPKLKSSSLVSVFFFPPKSRGDCSCRVFCRFYEEPLQVQDNGPGASLE